MFHENGKNIIFSADDFGISRTANANILKLAESGKLDRVEIMVSKNISPEHVSRLLNSGIKLDIHLHLAKEKLDYWQNNPRIIEKGAIKRIVFFLFNFLFGDTRPKIVEMEWEKQIVDFQNLFGKFPDGASSHEHIHFFPPYLKKLIKLSKKYNLPYIRFGKNPFKSESNVSAILNFLRKMNFSTFSKAKLLTSDYMISFDWNYNIDECVKKTAPNSKLEIIFHPELKDEFDALERL
jgi:predicted glycoside hydrolase/deacetylase ChbG (UPF0249 family)